MTPPQAAPSRTRRWQFGARAGAVLLLALLGIEIWASASTDPDYPLPDTFRPVAIAVLVLFGVSGFISARWLRRGLRTFVGVFVLAVLCLEVHARFKPPDEGNGRIEVSDDVLLRYQYRPGYEPIDRHGGKSRINHLGLWDEEHVIPKPADVYRVVVITGSIANDGGVPYGQRFVRVLERDLAGAAPAGKRVETINVSCEGYSMIQEVRLLEKVGLLYQPDIVVAAYMLTSAGIENGAYRRIGDSFFLFRFLPMLAIAESGSICSMYTPTHDHYSYDLVVRSSFERLNLLSKLNGFKVLVAVLPVLERFDDPVCSRLYDKVVETAKESGLETFRVVDAFKGESYEKYVKPGARWDVCHPNVDGHARIASALAEKLRPMIAADPHAR